MKDFIRLADGTEFHIEDGASLGNIVYLAENENDAAEITKKVTSDNVLHVEFFSKDDEDNTLDATGVYDDLVIADLSVDITENLVDDEVVQGYVVNISLREKSALEKRIDAIEAEQEMQNEAIDYLAME